MPELIPTSVHPLFMERLCYTLTKSGILFRTLLEKSLSEYDLIPPQSGILHILAGKESYNQNLLGQELSIDKASMVKFIDGLEKQKLLVRTTDPTDRRAKLLSLTAKGRKWQKDIYRKHLKLEEMVLQEFNEKERQELKALMPRVLKMVLQMVRSENA